MDAWNAEDLQRMKGLFAEGVSAKDIACALGKGESEVVERLRLVGLAPAEGPPPEPALGPDEEGDVIPDAGDDPAAWVHGAGDGADA